MELRLAELNSPEYAGARRLRYEVLRRPLGQAEGSEVNAREHECLHLVALEEARVVGCVLGLALEPRVAKLLQMAVSESQQGKGTGAKLVCELERLLAERGFQEVRMHARETARGFYQKLGYAPVGEPFDEVGIPHIEMRRFL